MSPILTPPYTGPPPPGLTKASDIAFWTSFVELDNAIPNPPRADAFLFYSGGYTLDKCVNTVMSYISHFYTRTITPWNGIYNFNEEVPGNDNAMTGVRSLFDSYRDNLCGDAITNLHIKCMSWSIARRAAIHGGTVHLALWKGDPLLTTASFWGAYEAGIITGPDSKVQRIVRYDLERVPSPCGDEGRLAVAVDPGVVVWERNTHKMLGVPFERQDWISGPTGDYHSQKVVWQAERLEDEQASCRRAGVFQDLLQRLGDMSVCQGVVVEEED